MRVAIVTLIRQSAPQRPLCFDSDSLWHQWLADAHNTGTKVTRRMDTGRHLGKRKTRYVILPITRINFCADCTSIRRCQMVAAKRCYPFSISTPPHMAAVVAVPASQESPAN